MASLCWRALSVEAASPGDELVRPLPGKDRVVIRGGQGVGDVLLIADPVAAVLGLAVNGIAGDAESLRRFLFH